MKMIISLSNTAFKDLHDFLSYVSDESLPIPQNVSEMKRRLKNRLVNETGLGRDLGMKPEHIKINLI